MKKLIFVIVLLSIFLRVEAQESSRIIGYRTPYGTFEVERTSNEYIPPPPPLPGLVLTQVYSSSTNEPDSIDHLFYVFNGERWEIEIPSSPRFPWGGLITSIHEAVDPGLLMIEVSSGASWGLIFVGENYGWRVFENYGFQPIDSQQEMYWQFKERANTSTYSK